ncbi:short chain dehydrogenase family protein [Mycobacterium kansasii]|uniref:Short chain dehydrogenase family protein n=1 Tax=Mycobacterium kansasii TaxID=1768 RepID=A0A1V3WUU9_MYCKA|nr:short chain dehydrogenase family protein [Mycobacterium kansasii]
MVTGAAAGLGRAEAVGWPGSALSSSSTTSAPPAQLGCHRRDQRNRRQSGRGRRRHQPARDGRRTRSNRRRLGGLDIVVNNAGITRDRMLFNMSDEDWDQVIAVHLRGHFLLTRNAAAYWRAKAKDTPDGSVYARLVNTSSEAGLVGPAGQANYGAAKAGITALTLSAARALAATACAPTQSARGPAPR